MSSKHCILGRDHYERAGEGLKRQSAGLKRVLQLTLLSAVISFASSGCSDVDGGDPIESADAGQSDVSSDLDGGTFEDAEVVGDDAAQVDASGDAGPRAQARYVQDHWIYENIETTNEQGAIVDLSPSIEAEFQGPADRTVQLLEGVDFQVYNALDGYMIDASGRVRDDVDVIVGFVESPTGRALAAVATPDEDARGPITGGDRVGFDLTFLGDQLVPGDVILVDMAFMQSIPSEDPSEEQGLSGLELLSHRMAAERVNFWGEERDGEVFVKIFASEIGVAVEGSTKAELPSKSQPMLDGLNSGFKECAKGLVTGDSTLDCVSTHFENFGDGAKSSLELIRCNLDFTSCIPIPNPTPPRCPGGCGSSSNDPHIVTLDGTGYDLQLIGEFLAAKNDSIELQIRTDRWGSSRSVSATTGAAIEVDGHRVSAFRLEDPSDAAIFIDGLAADLQALGGDGMSLGAGTIRLEGRTLRIESPDGDVVYIDRKWDRVDVYLEPSEGSTNWVGLFGNFDGDRTNDLKLRDGTPVAQPISQQELHETFGADWRLADTESLFDYAPGESTATFTDLTFPDEIVTVDSLPTDARQRAETVCLSVGIIHPFALSSCILDFALTGEIDMVRSARLLDVIEGIRIGARRPDGTLIDPDCTDYATCVVEICGVEAREVAMEEEPSADGSFIQYCPRDCTTRSSHSVWGTDIYSDDSSVCFAAIHAGVLGSDGGEVRFWRIPGQDSYVGSTQNGVTSLSWGAYDGSFVFEMP